MAVAYQTRAQGPRLPHGAWGGGHRPWGKIIIGTSVSGHLKSKTLATIKLFRFRFPCPASLQGGGGISTSGNPKATTTAKSTA
jgi:hypothetical protein